MADIQNKRPPSESKSVLSSLINGNSKSPLLHLMEERISLFEQSQGKKSGLILGFISVAVFAFASIASEIYMPKLPIIEIMFVAYLVGFLFNYYLIRDGDLLPFIEDEAKNFVAKIAGLSAFFSTILFIYSFQECELETALFCFGSSWIFYSTIEQFAMKQQRISRNQFLAGLAIIGLAFGILKPNFSPEFKQVTVGNSSNQDVDTPVDYIIDYTHLFGVIAAVISGIIFAYSVTCIRCLKKCNFITVTHIIIYIQTPFIPAFFPLQNLVSPSLSQWLFMCGLGIIFVISVQLFIRSIQIESSSKSLLVIPQFIATVIIFSMFLGVSTFGVITRIKFMAALCILGFTFYFFQTEETESNNNQAIDQKNNNIPLEALDKENEHKTLEQKLIDVQNV